MHYNIEDNDDIFNAFKNNFNDKKKLFYLLQDVIFMIEMLENRYRYEDLLKESFEHIKALYAIEMYKVSKAYIEYRLINIWKGDFKNGIRNRRRND